MAYGGGDGRGFIDVPKFPTKFSGVFLFLCLFVPLSFRRQYHLCGGLSRKRGGMCGKSGGGVVSAKKYLDMPP
jgi:hypothetical protein